MFFKIGVLKNFSTLTRKHCAGFCRPFYRIPKVAASGFLRQQIPFFQLNLVFIGDSRTSFCSEFLWKHELNLRRSHWSSLKKGVLRSFANFTGKHLCWILNSCGILKLFKSTKFRSANDYFWNLFFHLDCHFDNLHFWLKLLHSFSLIIIFSFVCQYSFRYYWYYHNQKQLSSAVLQKRCSNKFCKIHKKTPKKRFHHRCFLVNSAKFLITSFLKNHSDGCFTINTP